MVVYVFVGRILIHLYTTCTGDTANASVALAEATLLLWGDVSSRISITHRHQGK
jgi:hypothetical protein